MPSTTTIFYSRVPGEPIVLPPPAPGPASTYVIDDWTRLQTFHAGNRDPHAILVADVSFAQLKGGAA